MIEVACSICGQPWWVETPPALPLYPRGLLVHYCKGERVVQIPRTADEIALVGSSVKTSRLNAWPAAASYLALLLDVARIERVAGPHADRDTLEAGLRGRWAAMSADEKGVVKTELELFRRLSTDAIGVLDNWTSGQS